MEHFDLAAFYGGSATELYRTLGAHRTPDGWVFRVWAPHAAAMAVGGEFNDWHAAPMAREDPAGTWADMAKMKACQVYRDVSALSIQIHGGIGFTLEADPQLYFRRAKHLQLMYGDPLDLQERAGDALIAGTHKVLEA